MTDSRFEGLRAVFFNGTLTRSPEPSHTQRLIDQSAAIMRDEGVEVYNILTVYNTIYTGVQPDMTQHGWEVDEWPQIYPRVLAAQIVVVAGPIWLGDNSSMTKKLIERLYAHSGDTNEAGQSVFYGRVGGCLITGNEDGLKHCAQNILYSLQHIGFTTPPQADAGWIGEAGPGPSYGDDGTGLDNEFTIKNTKIMSWNLMHLASMLRDAGGVPAEGNVR